MKNVPAYMKRYFIRLTAFLSLYVVILIGGMTLMNGDNPPGQSMAAVLASPPFLYWAYFGPFSGWWPKWMMNINGC